MPLKIRVKSEEIILINNVPVLKNIPGHAIDLLAIGDVRITREGYNEKDKEKCATSFAS